MRSRAVLLPLALMTLLGLDAGLTYLETMPPIVALAIALPAERGARVPADAVRQGQVWVVEKETAYARAVRGRPDGEGMLLITRGLAPGEAIVRDPPETLSDGQPLRLKP